MRFSFFLILLLFVLVGAVCLFAPDVHFVRDNAAAPLGKVGSYSDFVLKDDFTIRSFISRIAAQCAGDNYECIAVQAFKFVKSDVLLIESGHHGSLPKSTLSAKAGDIADKAVLLASILENAGISTDIKLEDKKIIVYAAMRDISALFNEIIKDLHEKPLAKRDITLKNNAMWAVNLNAGASVIAADISAHGSKNFDMMLFPNAIELNAFVRGEDGRILSECSRLNVKDVEISCVLPSGSRLLFASKSDDNIFSGHIFKGGILLGDIKYESAQNGAVIVPMDVSVASDTSYPGILLQ